jgi:MFS family permease
MRARAAITASYGHAGVLNALWGATLPATDARLDLGEGRIGAVLMVLAVGALLATPVAGRLAERLTARCLLRLAAPVASLALAGPALASSARSLAVAAAVLGVLFGVLNLALTVQAVAVERSTGRPVMATMHGTWTLGAVAGGAVVSVTLRAGIDVRHLIAGGAVAMALTGLAIGRHPTAPRHPDSAETDASPGSSAQAAPRRRTAGRRPGLMVTLGVIGAAGFVTEGAATDWAGVHATRVLDAHPATASLVYTCFFVAMTVVRFAGDAVRARLGAETTVRIAGWTATTGFALVLLAGVLPWTRLECAIAGWVLAGAGMAVVWPIVVSTLGTAAGRLSAVTTISYGGGLAGPALIGYVAANQTLPVALLIPAVLALMVATVAPFALRMAASAVRHPTPEGDVRCTTH